MTVDRPTSTDDRQDAPGGDRALLGGCQCPVLDNAHGAGYLGLPGVFVLNESCMLHGRWFRAHHATPQAGEQELP